MYRKEREAFTFNFSLRNPALYADGNRVGQPLKSSLFGKSYGIEALERQMTKSSEDLKTKGLPTGLRSTIAALLANSKTEREFRDDLRTKGIDLILRYSNGGRLFGVTFIDHNSRTVLKGSALGKDLSANALSERFPDLATESQENKRATQPAEMALEDAVRSAKDTLSDERNKFAVPTHQTSHPTSQPTSDERNRFTAHTKNLPASASPDEAARPTTSRETAHTIVESAQDGREATTHSAILDLSPLGDAAGSLFSILTPNPGSPTDNNQLARKIQPKKPKRGRSV